MSLPDRAVEGGWREAAWQVLGSLFDVGRTRIELAAVELAEERLRMVRLCIAAVITMYLSGMTLALALVWLVLWCEPAQRLAALGGMVGLMLAGAVLAAWRWRRMTARGPALLEATLAELARDREALCGPQRFSDRSAMS